MNAIYDLLKTVNTAPEALMRRMDQLRPDLEVITAPGGGSRNFGGAGGAAAGAAAGAGAAAAAGAGAAGGWRSGTGSRFTQASTFDRRPASAATAGQGRLPPPPPRATTATGGAGRYQSKFTTGGNMDDKILNTIIGNKLNAFTPLTYNDTRDFIYQILDSGETEFIRDFVEKVFKKATQEEVYCAAFAKLIAEIAHRYPVMYEEMRKYHTQFLSIFDSVDSSGAETDYAVLVREKQYRMGYGQFLSELACLNTLEKGDLLAMVEKCMGQITVLAAQEGKGKAVEEYVDCLVRLTKALKEKSRGFFGQVREDLAARILPITTPFIEKTAAATVCLSITPKSRFGMMDLADCFSGSSGSSGRLGKN